MSNLTESNRQLREELERSNARGTEFYEGLINVSNKNLACQTALAADRKLLCRIATFLTQCDSSSPKVPELIADIEKSLSGVNEHHELTTRTALAAAKEALENAKLRLDPFEHDLEFIDNALAIIAGSEKENSNVAPTDLTQCDSSSPKVPELIADIEKSLSGVNEHHELTTRTALAAAKEALERIVGDRIDEDHPDLTNGQVMGEYSVGDMRQAKDALAFIAASEKENSNVAPADTSA